MGEIEEILAMEDIPAKIKKLKSGRLKDLPDLDKIKGQWDPYLHKTMVDKIYLPDKLVTDEDGNSSLQKVNRIALPLQKRIVNTAVSFTFGNPVKLNAEPKENSQEEVVLKAMHRLDHDCKLKSFNRRALRELLRSTEVAELWHTVEKSESHNTYGFDTKLKIRVAAFTPFNGDELYPYFDDTGDLVAFSRAFGRKDSDDKTIKYFETYTENMYVQWVQDGSSWVESKTKALPYGKIPIVFVDQEAVEWIDVQICIERLEYLLSKFAETNDYFSSPITFITGGIVSMPKKGESGKVIEGEEGSEAKILAWDRAPEAVKLEIETLIRFIHSQTQTPDISFDSVKGLSQISGEALQMLFTDARLKVEEKREILDDFLQRRVNIQKRIIGTIGGSGLKAASDNLEIEPEIIPFTINDETTTIANLVSANGGKPIISQRTAIKILGWVNDVDEELRLIEEEEARATIGDVFNPVQ